MKSRRRGETLRNDVEGLVEECVGDRQGREEAEDVAPGAAGEGHDAVLVAVRRDGGRAGGVRVLRPRGAQLDGLHRAAAADVGDDRVLGGQLVEAATELGAELERPGVEGVLLHLRDRAERGRAGDRVAAVGSAEPADVDAVHQLGVAGDGGQRQAAGDALGGGDQVGHDALVVDGEPRPGAAEAGLDLVGDEHDAVLRRPGREGRQEAGGLDEPALAEDRLDRDAGQVAHPDLLVEVVDRAGGGFLAGEAVTEGVGHRRAVDLGGERAEAVLVGHVLRRHRHRQVRAAVVGVVEDADRVAAGGHAGDLHGVLDGLGPGVEERRLLRVVAGRQLGQGFADLDVPGVRSDHEARVGEGRDLVVDGPDDRRRGVADRDDRDARAEVDEGVAVGVDEHPTTGGLDEDRQGGADPVRDRGLLAREQRGGLRSGDVGDEAAFLGEGRAAHEGLGHASNVGNPSPRPPGTAETRG